MTIAEKLTTIAKNEQKVYEAGERFGYNTGYNEAYSDGYTDGQDDGIWHFENYLMCKTIGIDLDLSAGTAMTKADIDNIFMALSPNTNGLTIYFSKMAVDYGYADPMGWEMMVSYRSNWNIVLI